MKNKGIRVLVAVVFVFYIALGLTPSATNLLFQSSRVQTLQCIQTTATVLQQVGIHLEVQVEYQ